MPQVVVTRYECDHNLLPALCLRCGATATEWVPRSLGTPPRSRLRHLLLPVFLIIYLAVPASIIVLIRLPPREEIGFPFCTVHRDDWGRRNRVRNRWLWPAVCLISLIVQIVCLAGPMPLPLAYAHAAAGVLVVGFVIDQLTIGRRETCVLRSGRTQFSLTNVHEAFVNALIHDRARDRVSNPDRRALRGDLRDDYDDAADS
jgi:hypothetical protein